MSFGTESSTPVGGQTLTGFIVSKAMQSRKDAKKSDRKERKKKEKNKESGEEKKQGIGTKLLGGLSSLPNLFKGSKPPTPESSSPKPRSSGGATGLAQILSSGFGSLTADNIRLSSSLASITQLLNSSYKAQSFTATGVQTISAILSDQLENQSSILSTVKSLKPGGGGSGGGSRGGFGTAGSDKVGGETLTGYLANKFDLGGKISQLFGKGVEGVKNLFTGGKPKIKPTTQYTKPIGPQPVNSASPWAKGAAGEAANAAGHVPRLPSAPIKPPAPTGMMGRLGNMFNSAKGAVGGAFKGIQSKVGAAVAEKVGSKLASKGALAGARAIPIAQQVLGIGLATKELMDGDIAGAGLALGSALPGPFGWGFLAADLGREIVGPELVDKSFGQALGGNLGLSDAKIQQRESTMSATERAMTSFSPSFTGLASGGMTFGKGLGNVMVGEAAGGSKGEAVVPLSSGIGKQMLGGGNSSGDPGMQTSAGSTLAVVDQFIKGMGPLGAPVAQALGPDIQQLSKTFGMSQTLPNLRIGGGKFKEDGNAKKTRDDFLEKLISGSLEALDAKKKGSQPPPKGTTQSNPGDTGTAKQQAEQQQRAAAMVSSINNMQIPGKPQGTMGTTGVSLPGGGIAPATPDKLKQVQNGNNKFWYDKDGQIYHWEQAKDRSGKPIPSELKRLNSGEMGEGVDAAGNLVVNQKDFKGKSRYFIRDPKTGQVKLYQPSWMETSGVGDFLQSVRGKGKDEFDNNIPQGYYSYKWDDVYLGTETKEGKKVSKWKRASGAGDIPPFGGTSQEFRRGGAIATYPMRVPVPISPQTAIQSSPSSNPIGATNQSDPQMNSVSIINVIGGGNSGGGSIPMRKSSSQDSSQYVSDPYPKGLAGVLCMSPWSVV
jgi:hypothetical protein